MRFFCRTNYGKIKTWSVILINGPFLCLWKILNDPSLKIHLNCVAFGAKSAVKRKHCWLN